MLKLIRCKSAEQSFKHSARRRPNGLRCKRQRIHQAVGRMDGNRRRAGSRRPGALEIEARLLNFMAEHHDEIYERTHQKGTFESINITLFEDPAEISETLQNNTPAPVPEWTVMGSGRLRDPHSLS
ncbi:DUF4937 domain-containing protein [Bacillus licheniformis]|nr:DUF4937 domain-containing protein [Bacillus licheniformis]